MTYYVYPATVHYSLFAFLSPLSLRGMSVANDVAISSQRAPPLCHSTTDLQRSPNTESKIFPFLYVFPRPRNALTFPFPSLRTVADGVAIQHEYVAPYATYPCNALYSHAPACASLTPHTPRPRVARAWGCVKNPADIFYSTNRRMPPSAPTPPPALCAGRGVEGGVRAPFSFCHSTTGLL